MLDGYFRYSFIRGRGHTYKQKDSRQLTTCKGGSCCHGRTHYDQILSLVSSTHCACITTTLFLADQSYRSMHAHSNYGFIAGEKNFHRKELPPSQHSAYKYFCCFHQESSPIYKETTVQFRTIIIKFNYCKQH